LSYEDISAILTANSLGKGSGRKINTEVTMDTNKNFLKLFSILAVLTMLLSNVQPPRVQAQGGDGLKRQVNAQNGRIHFIGPENGHMVPASKALGLGQAAHAKDPAMALAERFGPEFGLKNPGRELAESKKNKDKNGKVTVKYQQKHEGVPVMAGELIVNTDENGDLYSINGEISPLLAISTQPAIGSTQAKQTALSAMAKWYQKTPEDFTATEPELWIYDESLLQPSTRPVELTWRMEVTAKDNSMPVRELVLVNAERGSISLHFNQVDTAWTATRKVEKALQTSNTWYVAPTGSDANTCNLPAAPCQTIQAAVDKTGTGDIVKVATGTYTRPGLVPSVVWYWGTSLTLSGGWNSSFSSQTGYSVIDGQSAHPGIKLNATLTIDHFIIQNGFTTSNGGGIDGVGSLAINNSLITKNTGHNGGGGIYISGNVTLNNSTISENYTLSRGGGVLSSGLGSITLNNSTIAANRGGGIALSGVSGTGANPLVTIQNSTIVRNTDGGGIWDGGSYPSRIINITNSIIASNTAQWGADCSAGYYGPDHVLNIASANNAIFGNTTQCAINGGSAIQLNIDPKVADYPTGKLQYISLLNNSPAIDAGSNCLATDQRGVARPQGAACDIGAYEYTVPGPASSMIVAAGDNQGTALSHDLAVPLSVYVLDGNGSPVAGQTVTFSAPGNGASGVFQSSGKNTTTAVTNTGGLATASTFTTNGIAGSYIVTTMAAGIGSPAEFHLENQVAIASSITVSGESQQSAYMNIYFDLPLSTLVKDQFGAPLPGVIVSYTAPPVGASAVFDTTGTNMATAITNAEGIATVSSFVANGIQGTYTINATVSGVASPATFQLTNMQIICSIVNQTYSTSLLYKPFKSYSCYGSSGLSYGIGSGDLNSDGRQDIVYSSLVGSGPQHMLLIFLQDTGGSYSANPISYMAGNGADHLEVADLNHDGRTDVVTADYSDNTISVYLQKADGTLARRVIYSTGIAPNAIAIGDVNNDGWIDIAVSHGTSATIGVFTQKSNGTLNAMTAYASMVAGNDDIAIGDVNNDGRNDVVKMNGQGDANPDLMVYLQAGNGTLNAPVNYTLGCNCLSHGIDIGDVTSDGKNDVIISYGDYQPSSKIAVFPQGSNTGLNSPVSYNAYNSPQPVEIADIDGDGKSDIVTAHAPENHISILPQTGNGQFSGYFLLETTFKSQYSAQDLLLKDLNNDALPDILLAGVSGPIILYH